MAKLYACVVLGCWLLLGIYFGIGGYVTIEHNFSQQQLKDTPENSSISYDGIVFKNKEELQKYRDQLSIDKYFLILQSAPNIVVVLLTACSFGLVGMLINILYRVSVNEVQVENTKFISAPLLGFLTGIVITALAYIVPNVLVSTEANLKPMSISFFSLFGGMSAELFYRKILGSLDTIFKFKN